MSAWEASPGSSIILAGWGLASMAMSAVHFLLAAAPFHAPAQALSVCAAHVFHPCSYVVGDSRFQRYCKSNPRKMVKMWAEKVRALGAVFPLGDLSPSWRLAGQLSPLPHAMLHACSQPGLALGGNIGGVAHTRCMPSRCASASPSRPHPYLAQEMRNLARLHAAGILCPKPLQLRLHVLGELEGHEQALRVMAWA